MALSILLNTSPLQFLQHSLPPLHFHYPVSKQVLKSTSSPNPRIKPKISLSAIATVESFPSADHGSIGAGRLKEAMISAVQLSPLSWQSALLSNLLIFIAGSPILVSGLSLSGIGAAFLLGTLTWRAFGPSGFLLVASYFVIGTAATKLKMAQKEAEGVAEKRKGRRGPGSVIGSSTAACVCAFFSIYGVRGQTVLRLWELGFVACFCTKLSDTVASEMGKAYGKTTYLVTTFKVVPRGTEGAVSLEGSLAGLLASVLLASIACIMSEINAAEAIICIAASQIANFAESVIGAALQERKGFRWLNNDAVNIINVSMGSILAILMQQFVLQNWPR